MSRNAIFAIKDGLFSMGVAGHGSSSRGSVLGLGQELAGARTRLRADVGYLSLGWEKAWAGTNMGRS